VSKTPANVWRYRTETRQQEGRDYAPFRTATDGWHRFQITFRTWEGRYDLTMDDEVVTCDAPATWAAGLPVTGVYLHSGRGAVGEPMHFADIGLSVREPTPVEVTTSAPLPPEGVAAPKAFDRMELLSGELNGVDLSIVEPTLVVSPGARIRGRLEVAVTNEHARSGDSHVRLSDVSDNPGMGADVELSAWGNWPRLPAPCSISASGLCCGERLYVGDCVACATFTPLRHTTLAGR
jgi:hypothetical protein